MKMRALLSLIYRVKCQIYVIDIISSFLYYCKIYIKYEVSLKLVSEDIRAGEWSCPQSPPPGYQDAVVCGHVVQHSSVLLTLTTVSCVPLLSR